MMLLHLTMLFISNFPIKLKDNVCALFNKIKNYHKQRGFM
jgi:hypothetical protein